jgi:hypothetical protein
MQWVDLSKAAVAPNRTHRHPRLVWRQPRYPKLLGEYPRCGGLNDAERSRTRWQHAARLDIIIAMSTVAEIEEAIQQLPPEELARLREWFARFDAVQWDCQFEADVAAGRLDALASEAISDLRQGRSTEL